MVALAPVGRGLRPGELLAGVRGAAAHAAEAGAGSNRPAAGPWPRRPGGAARIASWAARHLATGAAAESLVGLAIVATLGLGAYQTWRFYERELRPYARAADTSAFAPPRLVLATDHEAVQRAQGAMDALGEATTYVSAGRYDWARAAVQRALDLDAGNPAALALQARLERLPEPVRTPGEAARRARDDRVAELHGAANAFVESGDRATARRLLEEAAALDPQSAEITAALRALDERRPPS